MNFQNQGQQMDQSSIFSQLFGQGQRNLQKALPTIGNLVGPSMGQDPLQQLLQQYLMQNIGNQDQMGNLMQSGLFGISPMQSPQNLALGGIMELFRNNPQMSLFGQQGGANGAR